MTEEVKGLDPFLKTRVESKPWNHAATGPESYRGYVVLDGLLRVFCLAKMERKWRMGVDVGSNCCLILGEG